LKTYQAGKPIDELARELGLKKISKLASNENPLGPSPFAVKEMTQGLWDLHRYPDMNAFRLKEALANHYKLKHNNIILGNGSEGIMSYIARTFLAPNMEVLTSEKTFIGFYIICRSVGASLKLVPMTNDYRFDVVKLVENISGNTKIIYLANPNNPTGTYITKKEFDYLMDNVPDHVLVILDEAYFEYAQDREDYPNTMNYRYDNIITLRTFSKAYGLAGVRVGYGFGHEDLINNLTKVKLPFEPNLIGQLGACGAIEDQPHLTRTLESNKLNYDKALSFLIKKNFSPIKSLTNFITFKTGSGEASNYLFQKLCEQGVIIRPLVANEMPDFVRLSIGTNEEMKHFYEAMGFILPEYDKKFGRVV
jgi:histidinol-phosphate aminotransferase